MPQNREKSKFWILALTSPPPFRIFSTFGTFFYSDSSLQACLFWCSAHATLLLEYHVIKDSQNSKEIKNIERLWRVERLFRAIKIASESPTISLKLSQPQLNHNSIQKLGLTGKWPCTTTHHRHTNSISTFSQLFLTRF